MKAQQLAAKESSVNSVEENAAGATKNYTPPKGRVTPKRARRTTITAPPKNNKEARKRMREQLKAERAQNYDGARRGDAAYLPKRDQGPVRRLVRDIVDVRRNMGPWFFLGTLIVVIGSRQFMPIPVRSGAVTLWLCLIVVMVGDVMLLTKRLRRTVVERFPDEPRGVGLYLYAVMRSVVFRKWRTPAPAVELGDPV